MRKLLIVLGVTLVAWPVHAQPQSGGPTAPAPWPTQYDVNLLMNPNFNTTSSWTLGSCSQYDATVTHTADGSGSVKVQCASAASTVAIQQNIRIAAHEGVALSCWVETDASFNGQFNFSFFDETHGDGTYLAAQGRTQFEIGNGATWTQIGTELFPYMFLHANDLVQVRLNIMGQTAGTAHVDDCNFQSNWISLRNFVANGQYVWTDLTPTAKTLHPTNTTTVNFFPNPVAGQISGVAEIDPPPPQSLSTITLTETISSSDSTCATGVLSTKTFSSGTISTTTPWSFTPRDYNGGNVPSAGTRYYVCSKLNVTIGGALIDTYPSFAVVFEDATFRSTLMNWFRPSDQAWMHNQVPQFTWGTYDRLSGENRCSVCLWSTGTTCSPNQASAKLCYLNNEAGPGGVSVAPASQTLAGFPGPFTITAISRTAGMVTATYNATGTTNPFSSSAGNTSTVLVTGVTDQTFDGEFEVTAVGGSSGAYSATWSQAGSGSSTGGKIQTPQYYRSANLYSYAAARINMVMGDIIGMSTVCPAASGICSGDQLSPFLDALASVGISDMQIVNNWYHCVVGETQVTPCPAFGGSATGITVNSGGSITASNLYLEFTEVVWNQPTGSANFPQDETLPSPSQTVVLSTAPSCLGTSCQVVFTTPTCGMRGIGINVYASTDNVTFTQWHPPSPLSGMPNYTAYPLPCNTSITMNALVASGVQPPGTAQTINTISRSGSTVIVTVANPLDQLRKGALVHVVPTDATDFPPGYFGVSQTCASGSTAVPCGMTTLTYTQSGSPTSSSGGTVAIADNTSSASPTWQGSSSPDTNPSPPPAPVWPNLASTISNATHAAGAAGIYAADEPLGMSQSSVFYQEQTWHPKALGMPVWCTLIDGTATAFWRDECDILNRDQYGYGAAADPDDLAVLPSLTSRSCSDYTSTFNSIAAAADCFPQRADIWVDATERSTYGFRPDWEVLQLFQRGAHLAFTQAELYRQALEAIVAEKNWGVNSGVEWWGYVSASGMENTWFTANNTQGYFDFVQVSDEIMSHQGELLDPILDSPVLNGGSGQVDGASGETVTGGQVLSNVQIGTAVGTVCPATSAYTSTNNFPFGPVRFAAWKHAVSKTGFLDQEIMVHNLCDNSTAYTVTLSLPSVPAATRVEVLNEGRSIPIQTSGCPNLQPACFTDNFGGVAEGGATNAGLDVHWYVIRQPRGMYIH